MLPEIMSKAHTTYKTASDVLLRVRVATHQLSAARKQAIAAYDEDLRALKNLDLKLATVETLQQPELFDIDASLTPELIRLLQPGPRPVNEAQDDAGKRGTDATNAGQSEQSSVVDGKQAA